MTAKLEDNYFSDTFTWIILISSASSSLYLLLIGSYVWIIPILIMISLISISTKYSLLIDMERKVVIDSFYILWIRLRSENFTFSTLKRIRLDKERHAYNAPSRSSDRKVDFNEYIGTLEYDDGKSIELARKMEYQDIAEEMKAIADQLNLSIVRTF
jgi:hypothetical protein